MLKTLKALVAGAALALASVSASAAVWSQTIDLNPDVKIPPTFNWSHNLTTAGFNPSSDLITDFTLTLTIRDDNDTIFSFLEWAFVDIPGLIGDALWFSPIGTNSTGPSFEGLVSLNANGLLNVSLSSALGDFFLDKSVLTATGFKGNAVPEPGALVLVGLGLAGLVLVRRRQQKQ